MTDAAHRLVSLVDNLPMPPIDMRPSLGLRSARTEAAEPTTASSETKPATPTPPPPAVDWTKTVDPKNQAAARARAAATVANPQAAALRTQNEAAEMAAVGGTNKPGVLLPQGGDATQGTTVTIHGINGDPSDVLPLGERAAKKGEATATFAWDDRSRRLGDSADDFARSIKDVLKKNPDAPLTINAHSMGGRVAAVALSRLEKEGALAGHDVRLNMVAPPLQGFASANFAGMGAMFAPSLRSSVDMGSSSDFQHELEGARLPNVKVRVFGGSADDIAKVDDDWKNIARNLAGGREPTVLLDADHMSAVTAAAKKLR
jgi:pimeloyl-ACP methyl ester carboxylesterase